jgi:hypothetical protein
LEVAELVRAPKNNRGKRLPVDPEFEVWIEQHVPAAQRVRGGLLFENARGQDPSRRWTPTSLHRRWAAACRAVGLTSPISLYEGAKHTFATNAKRRGIEERLLQRFLGHCDRRSVERDARLVDEALIAVLRPRRPTPDGDALSPACRQRGERSRKRSKPLRDLVDRTAGALPFKVALVETLEPPVYQQIARKALHLRELGMSDRVIAGRLGVTDKTIAKAIAWVQSPLAE